MKLYELKVMALYKFDYYRFLDCITIHSIRCSLLLHMQSALLVIGFAFLGLFFSFPGIGCPGITKCMTCRQYSQMALWATRAAHHSLCIDLFPTAGGQSDDGYNGRYARTNIKTVLY